MTIEQIQERLEFYFALLRKPFSNKRKKHFRHQIKHYKKMLNRRVFES